MTDRSILPNLSELRKKRKEERKRTKGYLPALLITVFLWFFWTVVILFVDPTQRGALNLFFLLFFLSVLFTFSLLFANTRRGVVIAISTSLFLFLMYLGVGTPVNFVLLLGASLMFEIYFTKRK